MNELTDGWMARWLDTVDADAPDCNRKFDTQQFNAICWTRQTIFHTQKRLTQIPIQVTNFKRCLNSFVISRVRTSSPCTWSVCPWTVLEINMCDQLTNSRTNGK